MLLEDLNLTFEEIGKEVKINDELSLSVNQYLPVAQKIEFIQYVIGNAMNPDNGTFSPIRVEVFFGLGLCRFYADLDIGDINVEDAYDLLDSNHIIDKVNSAIPQAEREFMHDLVIETVEDVARYNSSAAGIIHAMTVDAEGLDSQISDILQKVQNKEGIEVLSEIKNVVGKGPIVVKKG